MCEWKIPLLTRSIYFRAGRDASRFNLPSISNLKCINTYNCTSFSTPYDFNHSSVLHPILVSYNISSVSMTSVSYLNYFNPRVTQLLKCFNLFRVRSTSECFNASVINCSVSAQVLLYVQCCNPRSVLTARYDLYTHIKVFILFLGKKIHLFCTVKWLESLTIESVHILKKKKYSHFVQ